MTTATNERLVLFPAPDPHPTDCWCLKCQSEAAEREVSRLLRLYGKASTRGRSAKKIMADLEKAEKFLKGLRQRRFKEQMELLRQSPLWEP